MFLFACNHRIREFGQWDFVVSCGNYHSRKKKKNCGKFSTKFMFGKLVLAVSHRSLISIAVMVFFLPRVEAFTWCALQERCLRWMSVGEGALPFCSLCRMEEETTNPISVSCIVVTFHML